MQKSIFTILISFMLLNQFLPSHAFAYTYGDPNEEKVAEVYKDILIKLDENPPNFVDVKALYETVQEEIDMHMGKEPSEVILSNIEKEDKKLLIENYEKLLVLNIARRLENIETNFSEYDTSKRLLAKAFATYKALSPKVEAKQPEVDKKVKQYFDEALNSLGNPGLFGVGQKESNLEQFKKSKTAIFSALQDEFKMESLEVGHFSASDEPETKIEKKEWTDTSNLRNWVPLVLLVGFLSAIIIYVRRKRKR